MSMSELFSRDPLSLSNQDLKQIVTHMRDLRMKYEQGIKTPRKPKPTLKEQLKQSIKELDLDIQL